jgi:hypothetical protein
MISLNLAFCGSMRRVVAIWAKESNLLNAMFWRFIAK